MKLELTDRQFRYLLDLVYIGNWVLNATRGDDRIEEYDQVESAVFSHCLTQGMGKLVEHYQGSLIPSRAFADGGIHEAIEQYEDTVFYEILAEELALKDLNGQPAKITPLSWSESTPISPNLTKTARSTFPLIWTRGNKNRKSFTKSPKGEGKFLSFRTFI